ncbi:MAG: radical SAM family heme chaperone HemW [Prevotella sp.]|nr:radical SAM family heme chaperone HemW [Prevotella sp.]
MPATSLYIHVPFCQSRCIYCDFYSTTRPATHAAPYVRALEAEMAARAEEAPSVSTVYLGGGTPSQLTPQQIEDVFRAIHSHFRIASGAEITVELNPDDVTPTLSRLLKALGVNRTSLGVQTFSDTRLQFLRRRHDARQAREAVEGLAREIGNVSVDLIYGLPGQTEADWAEDVRTALNLPVTHLSAYALTYEPGTRLWQMRERGEVQETDDESSRSMYMALKDMAEQAGFEHYEVSNFARPGYASRHNNAYWLGLPYIGLGPGAHSYDGKRIRRRNLPDLHAYNSAPGSPPAEREELTDTELYDELVMTRLRLREGITLDTLSAADRDFLLNAAAPHLSRGTLAHSGNRLHLTREGLFVSDAIMADLMRG